MQLNKKTVLVLNSGSSSIKFAVIDLDSKENIINGIAEELHSPKPRVTYRTLNNSQKILAILKEPGHKAALDKIVEVLHENSIDDSEILGIGHRVVHGGSEFIDSAIADMNVIEAIRNCIPLAPLHNPANLNGIEVAKELFPTLSNVAVFDTAFHQTIEPKSYLYALPYNWYEKHLVRKYGFHGTSHKYVNMIAIKTLESPLIEHRYISLHLGNGCSAAAVKNLKCMDTTMGFTPLSGLVMGTRCGDIDSSLIPYIQKKLNLSLEEISNILNKESGLLGVSGISSDMRILEEKYNQHDAKAIIAIDIFCYKVATSITSLMTATKGIDGIIFTGGIGENSSFIRNKVIEYLSFLDIFIDINRNKDNGIKNDGIISSDHSKAFVLVIPTNEELMIALEVERLLK